MSHERKDPEAPPSSGAALSGAGAEALTAAILARTSGSPCGSAEERLLARSEGVPADPSESALLEAHLAHCAACASFARAVEVMREGLPALAELDPGPWFTEQVLRRTVQATPVRPAWVYQAQDIWSALVRRPRIALETAYVAAMLAFLLLGSPGPFVREIASNPASVTGRGLLVVLRDSGAGGALGRAGDALGLTAPARALFTGRVLDAAGESVTVAEKLAHTLEIAGGGTRAAGAALLRGDPAGFWLAGSRAGREIRAVWKPAASGGEPSGLPLRSGGQEP